MWWPWSRGKGAGKHGGGSILLGDLLIEVGERVFDAEDVHQLLGEGAGDGAINDKIGQLLFHSIAWLAMSISQTSRGQTGRDERLGATAAGLPVAVELLVGSVHGGRRGD